MSDTVEIFTDGACSGNPGPGGWGAVLRYKGRERELSGGEAETTNNRMELLAAIQVLEALKRRSALDWFHAGQAERLPFALVPKLSEIEELDHFRAREVFADFGHPDQETFRAPAIPFNFSATPLRSGGTAPRLGAQAEEVLRDRLSLSAKQIRNLRQQGIVPTEEVMA